MLPKFYKIISLEKKKKFIRVFSKPYGFASQDSLVVGSNGWGFCGVANTPTTIRGGGVTRIFHKLETSGGLIKWAIELSEFDIRYKPRTTVKGQVLADFIMEFTPSNTPA